MWWKKTACSANGQRTSDQRNVFSNVSKRTFELSASSTTRFSLHCVRATTTTSTFTSFPIANDSHAQETAGMTIETLDFESFFGVFDEIDPSAGSESDFTNLTLLTPLSTPVSALRAQLQRDGDDTINTSEHPLSQNPLSLTPTPRQKKPRRQSHVIREAREALLAQVRHLELQTLLLRQQAGIVEREVVAAKNAQNVDLRDAVLQQYLRIASTRSALFGYVNSRAASPLETYIHLGTDWTQRRDVLLGMKDRKVDVAGRFLAERTRHVNPLKPSCEVSTFETEQGDVCTVKVDVTPLEGVESVRDVFEALQFYFANMEISKTELSGKVTVRETEASVDNSVMQHRLVSDECDGVSLESNVVVFYDTSRLDADNVDDQCVVLASDAVDQDDLYPYRPSERLRKDACCVLKLSAHRRRRPQVTPFDDGGEEGELVVVLTRLCFVRLHHPQFDLPKQVLQKVSDDLSEYLDMMLKCVQDDMTVLKRERSSC